MHFIFQSPTLPWDKEDSYFHLQMETETQVKQFVQSYMPLRVGEWILNSVSFTPESMML